MIELSEDLLRDAQQSAACSSSSKEHRRDGGTEKNEPNVRHAPAPESSPSSPSAAAAASKLPKSIQEQIRRNQAKSALEGKGPMEWALGHRCEAFRLDHHHNKSLIDSSAFSASHRKEDAAGGGGSGSGGGGEDEKLGEWHEAVIRSLNAAGNFVVEFKGDRHIQEASIELVRPHREMLGEERYAPVAAPKLRKATTPSTGSDLPKSLVIRPTDDERTKVKKKKIMKSLKKKDRFVEMDRKQDVKKQGWQSFLQGKGSKKRKGFFTGRKKESIFKTPDDARGKVGVTGSGKGLTDYKKVKRHEFQDMDGQ